MQTIFYLLYSIFLYFGHRNSHNYLHFRCCVHAIPGWKICQHVARRINTMRAVFLFACACVCVCQSSELCLAINCWLDCENSRWFASTAMLESYRLAPRPIAMQIEALFSKAGEETNRSGISKLPRRVLL